MIYFSPCTVTRNSKRISVMQISKETTGTNGKLFDIEIHPDGTKQYSINCKRVDQLPKLPSVKELQKAVDRVYDDVVKYLNCKDQVEKNKLYWIIKEKLQNEHT